MENVVGSMVLLGDPETMVSYNTKVGVVIISDTLVRNQVAVCVEDIDELIEALKIAKEKC